MQQFSLRAARTFAVAFWVIRESDLLFVRSDSAQLVDDLMGYAAATCDCTSIRQVLYRLGAMPGSSRPARDLKTSATRPVTYLSVCRH